MTADPKDNHIFPVAFPSRQKRNFTKIVSNVEKLLENFGQQKIPFKESSQV